MSDEIIDAINKILYGEDDGLTAAERIERRRREIAEGKKKPALEEAPAIPEATEPETTDPETADDLLHRDFGKEFVFGDVKIPSFFSNVPEKHEEVEKSSEAGMTEAPSGVPEAVETPLVEEPSVTDEIFHLSEDPIEISKFEVDKKNEEFQELLDDEIEKIRKRQATLPEPKNQFVDEEPFDDVEPTPDVLVTGDNAKAYVEERIESYLAHADLDILKEIRRKVDSELEKKGEVVPKIELEPVVIEPEIPIEAAAVSELEVIGEPEALTDAEPDDAEDDEVDDSPDFDFFDELESVNVDEPTIEFPVVEGEPDSGSEAGMTEVEAGMTESEAEEEAAKEADDEAVFEEFLEELNEETFVPQISDEPVVDAAEKIDPPIVFPFDEPTEEEPEPEAVADEPEKTESEYKFFYGHEEPEVAEPAPTEQATIVRSMTEEELAALESVDLGLPSEPKQEGEAEAAKEDEPDSGSEAGMTEGEAGMTKGEAGMTEGEEPEVKKSSDKPTAKEIIISVLITIATMAVLICIVCFALLKFAPDTYGAYYVRDAMSLIGEKLFGAEPATEEEVANPGETEAITPTANKNALVSSQVPSKTSIEQIAADSEAAYNPASVYQTSGISNSTAITNNLLTKDGKKNILIDETAVACIIGYNSDWVSYMSGTNDDIFDWTTGDKIKTILEGEKGGADIAVTFKYLGIGDIRLDRTKVFVWTKEIITLGEEGATEMVRNKVYSLAVVDKSLKVEDIEIIK
ncbi:MAG: hypothetical protein LBN34_02545 [Clostridiales Family XIII bacterium]|jgi:hypothetical protein|nr:hypothetical protein [Clostridiales Family XIII bacterium]